MRKFRVRLTTNAQLERFVTVEVEDQPNAHLLAKAKADDMRKHPARWAVRGSKLDRFNTLEVVRMEDPSALIHSVFVGEAVEMINAVEVLSVGVDGYQRVALFTPTDDSPEAYDVAALDADAYVKGRPDKPGVVYSINDLAIPLDL